MHPGGLHGGGSGSACLGLEDTCEVDRWRGEGRIGPKHVAAGIKVTDEGKGKAGLGGRREGEKGGGLGGKKRERLTGGAWSIGHCQPGPCTYLLIHSLVQHVFIHSTCIEPMYVPVAVLGSRDTAVNKTRLLPA